MLHTVKSAMQAILLYEFNENQNKFAPDCPLCKLDICNFFIERFCLVQTTLEQAKASFVKVYFRRNYSKLHCPKNWYFVNKIVLTYCEKKLF